MNLMKVIALFVYVSGLIAFVPWLIMTINQVSLEGYSVFSVIAMAWGSIGIGWSFSGLLTILKELLDILTLYLQNQNADDDRQ